VSNTVTRRLYVDTSVIVARYKPRDELYNSAESLFNQEGIHFFVSPLTLVELYAALSRVRDQIHTPVSPFPSMNTLVALIIQECKLRVITGTNPGVKALGDIRLRVSPEYFLSMRLAQQLQLRALDLIHLAYASLARAGYGVSGFVTGDKEILNKSSLICKTLKLEALHPDQVTHTQ
jgi:predicted nucleic acid-binding protein